VPRLVALVVAVFLPALATMARQKDEPRDPKMECSIRLRTLATGIFVYADKHDGHLPPDLFAVANSLAQSEGKSLADFARSQMISPAHEGLLKPPAQFDAAWLNEGSSYKYLGNADVSINDIQEWGDIVIAHLRLEQGLQGEPTPQNPDGQLFTLAFLDGHVNLCTRAEAERLIEKSAATLDALRTGADAPEDRQAVQNIAMILKAVHAYAKAHEGKLPPDLGATLAFVPSDTRATATPKQRGRIFLSPRAQKNGSVPDEPTAEWVNANTWYVYLGSSDVKLDDIPEAYTTILVHAPIRDAFVQEGFGGKKFERVALGEVGGQARLELKGYAEWIVRESQKVVEAVRTGERMPEWVHAMRDTRLIADALRAYAKAHAGTLPKDLGELAEFLPENLVGVRGPRAEAVGRVFLTPRAEAATTFPKNPDAAWIAKNANFVYHGQPGAKIPDEMHADWLPLIHGPVDEAYRVMTPWIDGYVDVVPIADAFGGCSLMQKEWVVQRLADPGTTPAAIGGKD
jgi:hypothetical protein